MSAMVWSKEPPDAPGWYLVRKFQGRNWPQFVNVYRKPSGLLVGQLDFAEEEMSFFSGGEWAGPIPEPTEPGRD